MTHHTVSTDVLVIGGGMAGRAAIEASRSGARVAMVMKGEFGKSGTSAAKVAETAGYNAPDGLVDPEDNPGDEIDAVILGCPHASIHALAQIAALLEGKHVADGVRLWINAVRGTKRSAKSIGYAATIESAGGYILSDACPTNMRIPAKRIVTLGFKQGHYARGMVGAEVIVAETASCIRAAIAGRWIDHD